MQAITTPRPSTSQPQGGFDIYIDRTSVLAQAHKRYPDWCFDVGLLAEEVLKGYTLTAEKKYSVKIGLYGSAPPPDDTLWNAAPVWDVETIADGDTYNRSKIDADLTADIVDAASEAFHRQVPVRFIVVLGDRDLPYILRRITEKHGQQVDVWLWENALPHTSLQHEPGHQIQVHTLDKYIENIGWYLAGDSSSVPYRREGESIGIRVTNNGRERTSDKDTRRLLRVEKPSLCYWREYCRYGLACKHFHTKEEKEGFRLYGTQQAQKYRFCRDAECNRGSRCYFAHSDAELFCPTCGKSGAGHDMRHCPLFLCT
jgi:hypothetical protein